VNKANKGSTIIYDSDLNKFEPNRPSTKIQND